MDRRKPPHVSARKFNGPAEKRQWYISNLVSMLAESDPENRHFAKAELVEIHSMLRRRISTNRTLYRLVQAIVDEGVFLASAMLDYTDSDIEQIDESQIGELEEKLDQQTRMKKLIEFSRSKIASYEPPPQSDTLQAVRLLCNSLNCEVNNKYSELIGFDSIDWNNSIQQTVDQLNRQLVEHKQSMVTVEGHFKQQLDKDIEQITFEMCLKSDPEKAAIEVGEHLESCHTLKRKILVLHSMLRDLYRNLSEFETHLARYNKHRETKTELTYLKQSINLHCVRLASAHSAVPIPSEVVHKEIMDFFHKNLTHLHYNQLISMLRTVRINMILLQDKIDSLQCS